MDLSIETPARSRGTGGAMKNPKYGRWQGFSWS